eukprot:TRINITY_DN2788_c0_g1_i2.p1 TRINITY_DN2788_c0_g1~~TRINITY_DN2788_c0_g1_i2.p1  ORF type:complete len:642 (+),score=182.77 TRINITY_DN2788_c0_g1_i2:107-2032(+)
MTSKKKADSKNPPTDTSDDQTQAKRRRKHSAAPSDNDTLFSKPQPDSLPPHVLALFRRKLDLEIQLKYLRAELQSIELAIHTYAGLGASSPFPLGSSLASSLTAQNFLMHAQVQAAAAAAITPQTTLTDSRQSNGTKTKPSKQTPQSTPVPTTIPASSTPAPASSHQQKQATPAKVAEPPTTIEERTPAKTPASNRKGKSTPATTAAATTPAPRTPAPPPAKKEKLIESEAYKFAQAVLRDIRANPNSPPFLDPVDPVALNIPDYPTIVKHPMDFGTIKKKLQARQYADLDDFAKDVRLVFDNCRLYNLADSIIVKMCNVLSEIFETRWAKKPQDPSFAKVSASDAVATKAAAPSTVESVDPSEKAKLREDIMSLTTEQQCQFADLLVKSNPSLNQTDGDEIEIDIDEIDGATFRVLQAFVRDCIAANTKQAGASLPSAVAGDGEAKSEKVDVDVDQVSEERKHAPQSPMREEVEDTADGQGVESDGKGSASDEPQDKADEEDQQEEIDQEDENMDDGDQLDNKTNPDSAPQAAAEPPKMPMSLSGKTSIILGFSSESEFESESHSESASESDVVSESNAKANSQADVQDPEESVQENVGDDSHDAPSANEQEKEQAPQSPEPSDGSDANAVKEEEEEDAA